MTAKGLYEDFAAAGTTAGAALVFDDHTALELVKRAQEAGLAISDIDMVRPTELDSVKLLPARFLRDPERVSSWNDARSFVEMLAGRGLYFQVVLESAWSTRLARLRSAMRTVARDNTSSRLPGWP